MLDVWRWARWGTVARKEWAPAGAGQKLGTDPREVEDTRDGPAGRGLGLKAGDLHPTPPPATGLRALSCKASPVCVLGPRLLPAALSTIGVLTKHKSRHETTEHTLPAKSRP